MNGSEYQGEPGQAPRRLRNPGKASFNRGIAALSVAAAGYILGFLLPWAANSSQSVSGIPAGRFMFMPIGGIASFFLAIVAIQIGRKTKRFIGQLPPARRERLGSFMDVEKESRRASAGIALGIISIVANPLVGFFLITMLG